LRSFEVSDGVPATWTPSRVLLTGATGFIGRHALPVLEERYGADKVVAVSSADYDLTDRGSVDRMFDEVQPDAVVHFAAYVGGIAANRRTPADFYYRNTLLTAQVFDSAANHGVRKLVYPIGSCSYPATGRVPLTEDQLWTGYPQNETAGYSTAKLMGLAAARAYEAQYGLDATVLVLGNMYGEFANFDREASQVVSAMIRRYHEAKLDGANRVEMWGSGAPQRDFVHAADVAALLPFFIESFKGPGPVNIASGRPVTIKRLAELIAEHTGFEGEIAWDTSKPDGQLLKGYSVDRLEALGQSCPTTLEQGIARTARWFAANYADRGDGLRL
jgi:GDP-L-fucose synthase